MKVRTLVLNEAMDTDLTTLYHDALVRMHVSADKDVERLRRESIQADHHTAAIGPEDIARMAGRGKAWGKVAFEDLRQTGFIHQRFSGFHWYRPKDWDLIDAHDELAAMEAIAIIRLASMDCSPAMPGILDHYEAFMRAAEEGDFVETSLAHQRLMLVVVGATGKQRVAEDYVRNAKVVLAYGKAFSLYPERVEGMKVSAKAMIDCLGKPRGRECAAEAAAMRLHPQEPVSA